LWEMPSELESTADFTKERLIVIIDNRNGHSICAWLYSLERDVRRFRRSRGSLGFSGLV
jgi:hypothetical protein